MTILLFIKIILYIINFINLFALISTSIRYHYSTNLISFVSFNTLITFTTICFFLLKINFIFPSILIIAHLLIYYIHYYRRKKLYNNLEFIINSNNSKSIKIQNITFFKQRQYEEIVIFHDCIAPPLLQGEYSKFDEYKHYFPNNRSSKSIINSIQMNYNQAQVILNQMT